MQKVERGIFSILVDIVTQGYISTPGFFPSPNKKKKKTSRTLLFPRTFQNIEETNRLVKEKGFPSLNLKISHWSHNTASNRVWTILGFEK